MGTRQRRELILSARSSVSRLCAPRARRPRDAGLRDMHEPHECHAARQLAHSLIRPPRAAGASVANTSESTRRRRRARRCPCRRDVGDAPKPPSIVAMLSTDQPLRWANPARHAFAYSRGSPRSGGRRRPRGPSHVPLRAARGADAVSHATSAHDLQDADARDDLSGFAFASSRSVGCSSFDIVPNSLSATSRQDL